MQKPLLLDPTDAGSLERRGARWAVRVVVGTVCVGRSCVQASQCRVVATVVVVVVVVGGGSCGCAIVLQQLRKMRYVGRGEN